jgi:hypothetical protein
MCTETTQYTGCVSCCSISITVYTEYLELFKGNIILIKIKEYEQCVMPSDATYNRRM